MPSAFPPGPAAVLRALRFDRPPAEPLPELAEPDWKAAFRYSDRNRSTLLWYAAIESQPLPEWVRERFEANLRGNRARLCTLLDLYRDLLAAFSAAGVEHIVVKGPAQWPAFVADLRYRTQYDLDLFCPAESLLPAMATIRQLGYEPIDELSAFPTDHLPVLIRKTGWKWRGDFFDTDMPIAVELHFRFWDPGTERFGPANLDAFWDRRVVREIEGVPFHTLDSADALAYTCLHALRHLLRGDSHPNHLYEIAWFLHHGDGNAFWTRWSQLHDPALQQIQAICFHIAQLWFGCRLPPRAAEAVAALPSAVTTWTQRWGFAPLESAFRPNKNELWLHWSLLGNTTSRLSVLRRRLLPLRPPGPVGDIHVPAARRTLAQSLKDKSRYVQFVSQRFFHHTRVLVPTLGNGLLWGLAKQEISPGYWRFFGASMLFNLALFIFYILYNVYLAESGYREDVVGLVASAMSAGSLLGSLSASFFVSRAGLRGSLLTCFTATGLVLALRVLLLGKLWLVGMGFLGGVCQSLWAVCLSPTIAQLSSEKNRSFLFSLTFSSAITLGIAAGAIAGALPGLLGSMRNAIWLGCACAPLAAIPLWRLRVDSKIEARQFFTPNPFLLRFLAALFVWGLATGALSPFFNVYFAKVMHMTKPQIGLIFSASQGAQVVAMLAAPILLRRFGLVAGIALMQAGTAICLATLGLVPAILLGGVYCAYSAFQYMSEPGLYSLLMKGVPEEARTSASAWNFVVVFATHALSAAAAGQIIASLGYQPLLFTAAALILLAAFLFHRLLRESSVLQSPSGTAPGSTAAPTPAAH